MDERLQLKTLEEGTKIVGGCHEHYMEQGISPIFQVNRGQVSSTFRSRLHQQEFPLD